MIESTELASISAVFCHQGVHIGSTVIEVFSIAKGFRLAWDDRDLGVVVRGPIVRRHDVGPEHRTLIPWSMIHCVVLGEDECPVELESGEPDKSFLEEPNVWELAIGVAEG